MSERKNIIFTVLPMTLLVGIIAVFIIMEKDTYFNSNTQKQSISKPLPSPSSKFPQEAMTFIRKIDSVLVDVIAIDDFVHKVVPNKDTTSTFSSGAENSVATLYNYVTNIIRSIGQALNIFQNKFLCIFGCKSNPTTTTTPSTTNADSSSSSSSSSASSNIDGTDHLPGEYFDKIKWTDKQFKLLEEGYKDLMNKGGELQALAKKTHWDASSKHVIYRYYSSCEWGDNYYGKKIPDAVEETIRWRVSSNINQLHTHDLHNLYHTLYVSDLDQHRRPIIYFRPGRVKKVETPEKFLRILLYTIERADRMSIASGSGEIVAILDMHDFTFSKAPPLSVLRSGLSSLRLHYPYRLKAVYIINAGMAFNFFWKIVRPLLSRRVLSRTFVLDSKDIKTVIPRSLGAAHLESEYGGSRTFELTASQYFHSDHSSSQIAK